MATPFLGEIKMMSFDFPPKGWVPCNGKTLPINQNQALFSLLGTTFGGDGRTTFGVPNLQGRVAVDSGAGYGIGQTGGEPTHTLTQQEMPTHAHVLMGSADNGNTEVPTANVLARSDSFVYSNPVNLVPLNAATIPPVGSDQPHENWQPYLTINFCIAVIGIFPSVN